MKLSQRIHLIIKTAMNDLFGEEQLTEFRQALNGETNVERLTVLMDETQHQLDSLRLELGNAVVYQKRIELARQKFSAQVQAMDALADTSVQAGADDESREYLVQLNSARQKVKDLDELIRAGEQRSNELRLAVNQQQEQLDGLRRRALDLNDRERNVTSLSELLGDQQSLSHRTQKLHGELTAWEEQIAHREDLLSARQEWKK